MRPRPGRATPPLLAALLGCATAPPAAAPWASAFPRADSVHAEPIADGVTWLRVHDPTGPWAVHVLEIALDRCRPRVRAAKAGPPFSARATTSELGRDALAAINADFFELPGGMTVGAHVSGGVVRIGPGERPVLAFTAAGPVQGRARLEGWVAHREDTVPVFQVNRRSGPGVRGQVRLFTGGADTDSLAAVLRLRRIAGNERAGTAIVAGPPGAAPASLGADDVLVAEDRGWIGRRAPGDTVAWSVSLRVDAGDAPVLEAVGGFPTLLQQGRDVLALQPGVRPEFGARRHPRTAVGWNDRSIFWVVVDGRQVPYSDGMSLGELVGLFQRLGATDAINLDGGGSTAMVLRGRAVNRPSDPQGERAVGNALLLERCVRP